MAIRKHGIADKVTGIGRNCARLEAAAAVGAIDDWTTDLESGLVDADLIYIATPVCHIIDSLKTLGSMVKSGCIITDAGSTKKEICGAADANLPDDVFFIGGHPMAGSEAAGVDAARVDLFENAAYILAKTETTDSSTFEIMQSIIRKFGSKILVMSPESHDRCVSVISHLPHIIAAALTEMAESYAKDNPLIYDMIAGSFRDMTRVAGSSPELWRDICMTNSANISKAASVFKKFLNDGVTLTEDNNAEDFEKWFAKAKLIRDSHIAKK
ncbi:MAG: prephenate dehydrogenase [Armatimonadota bacterium]